MLFTLLSRQTPKLIIVKKIILFSALFVCVFASCKKNNSGSSSSNYHFTATIDGKAQTFNVSPFIFRVTNSGVSIITIEGFTGTTAANGQVLALSWTNSGGSGVGANNFTTGTYSDTAGKYSLMGVYNPTLNESFVGGTQSTGYASNIGVTGLNHLKLVITSLDSAAVKGTFSGDFYFNADLSGAKKSITNGDFFVPWKK